MPLQDVNTTLGALLGSAYVNDFNRFGRVYKVYVQAEPEFRTRSQAVRAVLRARSQSGQMVPLDTLVDRHAVERTGVHQSIQPLPLRRGHRRARARVQLGAGADRAREVARETLPPEMGFDWADMSFQEKRAPNPMVVFALAIFLVFLVLAAQYESWGLPFSVLLGTPFAAFGAYFGLWVARQFSESYVNNVFAQIGLIMLIGLAAKNAILIVEFAKMLREQGKDPVTAALEGARLRFRPILMTAFAFILGVVPLLLR